MQANLAISPAQSAMSAAQLPAYDAKAEFKNISVEVGANYKLTDRWSMTTKLGYSRLLGDASNSPVTASKSQYSGGIGLSYTFGRTR